MLKVKQLPIDLINTVLNYTRNCIECFNVCLDSECYLCNDAVCDTCSETCSLCNKVACYTEFDSKVGICEGCIEFLDDPPKNF